MLVPVLAAFNSEMSRYGCSTKEHENKQLCDTALHARPKTFSLFIFVQCGNDRIKGYLVHYGRNCNDWPTRRSSMSLGSDQRGWFTFDWHNDAKIEMLFTLTCNYSSSFFKLTFNASTFNVSTRCSALAITSYLILCTRVAVISFFFFFFFF